jgi:hypothetical protein
LAPALNIFADATTVSAVDASLLRSDATSTRLFTVAFDACRSARDTGSMYSLTRSTDRLVDVGMTLAEMAVQYVSSGKGDTADVTRVVWIIVVVVGVAGQGGPSLVCLATNRALVHCEASDHVQLIIDRVFPPSGSNIELEAPDGNA